MFSHHYKEILDESLKFKSNCLISWTLSKFRSKSWNINDQSIYWDSPKMFIIVLKTSKVGRLSKYEFDPMLLH